MTLSQQERAGLEGALRLEHLCIEKYANYAQQASDPQLKQMFSQHGQHEKQHAQTVEQLLQGQQPQQGGGQQQNQAQYAQQQNQAQAGFDNDMLLCSDLLMTEDHASGAYDKIVFATANPAIRQAVQHIQKEEQQHGADIINYMSQHSQYSM